MALSDNDKAALALHKKLHGKITLALRQNPDSVEKLGLFYTPGVAAVSRQTAKEPQTTRDYTWTGNNVAVISDGSAVLGLGNIGPEGALPVMEGKALLFKYFADIDGVPIVLDTQDPDEIIATVKAIAPSFGGINLEDIAAPQCFYIEEALKEALDIPVFHDDQHGTAIVVLAGLINAMKLTGKSLSNSKIVVAGAGAAGTAIVKLLHKYAQPEMYMIDSKGIISAGRSDLNKEKQKLLEYTNTAGLDGSLEVAMKGADIFIGVSKAGLITEAMVRSMNKDPVIFAMANPEPEIMPDQAAKAGAVVIATGRSDFPNQINNAVCFPGVFRGALDNRVRMITDEHKLQAAEAIAALVDTPRADCIIPSVLDERTVSAIANVIR